MSGIPDSVTLGKSDIRLNYMCLSQLPVEGRPESAALSVASGEGAGTRPTTPADEVKSSTSKSGTPSGKKKKGVEPPPEEPPADAAGEDGEKRSR